MLGYQYNSDAECTWVRKPNLDLSSEGQIQIVSTQFKGTSFITDLNIADFLP